MTLDNGPKGFVLGMAKINGEWRLAWVRETDTGAIAFWIDHRGDYGCMRDKVGFNGYIIDRNQKVVS